MSTAVHPDTTRAASSDGEERPAARRTGDLARTLARGVGQTLLTVGFVVLLFVAYQLWFTDVLAAREQQQLAEEIQEQWASAPTVEQPAAPPAPAAGAPTQAPAAAPEPAPPAIDVAVGQPFSILHVPALGEEYARVVVEGVSQVELAQGPGHYIGTAMPGEQGNFAVAGHRVGHGAPFLDLDTLRPGDPIVVETEGHWFTYRVLGDPTTGDFSTDPSGIPGRRIVHPTDVAVISPTPGGTADEPASGAYLTLTTCHPKYSAQQRLIIHAALDGAPLSKATAPDGPSALNG
ncbi:class E sortase [Blastococcus sp. PRF04-17]|uniref:class E sortase n=1 Tax=Blastococcus sp. PRF04-17 TaxID=2933797 RepID=UPI001FF125EA|nr:class E sortase [Blastococcus sp. PRF04-17]UOY00493.1 class E sortase [Blastococcus sp. PRF04-17]